jgi:hypothetical protein
VIAEVPIGFVVVHESIVLHVLAPVATVHDEGLALSVPDIALQSVIATDPAGEKVIGGQGVGGFGGTPGGVFIPGQ